MIDEIETFLNESLMHPNGSITDRVWRPNLTRIYLQEVYEECRQIIKKIIKLSNNNNDCNLLTYMPNTSKVLNDLRTDLVLLKQKYAPFFFITINSRDEDWEKVFKDITSMKDWKCVEEGLFVVETRASPSPTAWTGIHFHILIHKHNIALSTMKRKINLKFKKYIDSENKNDLLNVQLKDHKYLRDKMEYIKGQNKFGNEKQEKQEEDKRFRKHYNLKEWYEFEGFRTDKNPSLSPGARVGSGKTLCF